MAVRQLFSRREAIALLGGATLAGVVGLSSCGKQDEAESDPHARKGFAPDTLVKDYPVHIKLYADSNMKWMYDKLGQWGDGNHLEHYFTRYQAESDRADVTFEVTYVDPFELARMVSTGFADGDGVIGLTDSIAAGCNSGVLDGGKSRIYVRNMTYNFNDFCCVVRAAGSDVELPKAPTIDGEDSPDGHFTKFRQLTDFDGKIALADPSASVESIMANNMMESAQLCTFGDNGEVVYKEGLADKFVVFPDQESAMAAVANGDCQIGFALESSLEKRFTQLEELCRPGEAGSQLSYSAAPTSSSAEPEVVRDFFEFIILSYD